MGFFDLTKVQRQRLVADHLDFPPGTLGADEYKMIDAVITKCEAAAERELDAQVRAIGPRLSRLPP